jgi:YD repeat-containing protein
MKRWIICTFVIVVGIIGGAIWMFIRPFVHVNRQIHHSQAEMVMPENFKPAELVLARMCQSDPHLFEADPDGLPPDWTPPEIGKLLPHYITIKPDEARVDMGGGFIDNYNYILQRDVAHSDAKNNVWVLTYTGQDYRVSERVLDRITLAATDHIDEDELVRKGLAELDRRKTAFATGEELNIYGDDPVDDRARLLSQHSRIAKQLGLAVPETAASTKP